MSFRFSRGLCLVRRGARACVGGWVGALALVLVSHSTVLANCAALGGSVVAGVCTVSSAVMLQGEFSLTESLRITGAGSIRVPQGQTLSLDIPGDLTIDSPVGAGGRIVGDATTPDGRGADISVTTSGNIVLQMNARITSEANANGKAQSSCATSHGGSIRLNAGGDVTTVKGSLISTSSKCTAGEIDIAAAGDTSLEGSVLAQSLLTGTPWGYPGGGPIAIDAGGIVTVQSAGIVSSKGLDQGADLVHVAGGCGVNIFGLVQSTGPGHVVPTNPPNRCNLNDRPHDTIIDPMACVEVWSGGPLVIDRSGARKGEINADTGKSGGTKIAWIDLFAAGDITILGHASKYAVHANQFLTNGSGGIVTVMSVGGAVTSSRAAIQANVTASGGKGGVVTVEAAGALDLGNALIQAKGGTKGHKPAGGVIDSCSFNYMVTGVAPGSLDARGGTPATGTIIIHGCIAPGVKYTGTMLPATAPLPTECGGTPVLPWYVTLPTCSQGQPRCGDGTVNQVSEQCDDGNTTDTDACTNACQNARCGDSIVGPGEQCDDGNQVNIDACTNACQASRCGDGIVGPGEQCDDGNQNNTDSCSNACQVPQQPVCGNGTREFNEECDDGNKIDTDNCTNACQTARCGDGIAGPGEQCDDGNSTNTDACTNACRTARCGDGIAGPGEQCDDGNSTNTDACTNACRTARCGDGIVGPGEACDDGNSINTDICTNGCQNAACGDGFVGPSEQCDDSNTMNGDGCSASCQTEPRCGNGVKEGEEQCDDGNTMSGDGCSSKCEKEVCGNGTQDAHEQCDDGNTMSGDGCSSKCEKEVCGNGTQDAHEQCDDGNTMSGDGCSSKCEEEECGNGTQDAHEQCDDGNTMSGDGCSSKCEKEVCGNGTQDAHEQCDDGNTMSGDGCSSKCETETSWCGNGAVDPGEVCDDGDTNNGDSCFNNCQGGNQGCTIGYWKQDHHFDDWTAPYVPEGAGSSLVGSVFTMPNCPGTSQSCILGLAGDTFLTALDYPGGDTLCDKEQLLIKQAVGGVLNAAHDDINYPVDNIATLAAQVNTALASCDAATIIALQGTIDGYNNLHNNDVCGD